MSLAPIYPDYPLPELSTNPSRRKQAPNEPVNRPAGRTQDPPHGPLPARGRSRDPPALVDDERLRPYPLHSPRIEAEEHTIPPRDRFSAPNTPRREAIFGENDLENRPFRPRSRPFRPSNRPFSIPFLGFAPGSFSGETAPFRPSSYPRPSARPYPQGDVGRVSTQLLQRTLSSAGSRPSLLNYSTRSQPSAHARPWTRPTASSRLPDRPALQKFSRRDRLVRGFPFRRGRSVVHGLDEFFVVVVEVNRRRIFLLGPHVGALAEDRFGGPAVMMMLPRQVDRLVTNPINPRGAVCLEAQMRVMNDRAHTIDRWPGSLSRFISVRSDRVVRLDHRRTQRVVPSRAQLDAGILCSATKALASLQDTVRDDRDQSNNSAIFMQKAVIISVPFVSPFLYKKQ
jgi:hypothetical protein